MRNSVAAVSSLLAMTLVGPLVAQAPQVVNGPDLVATGKVISVGNTSIAIRTDDHGHSISFLITTTTQMPTLLAVGSRVRVAYHAVGPTGQMADKITLLEGPPGANSPAVSEFTGASVQPNAPAPPSTGDAAPAPRVVQAVPQSPAAPEQPSTWATELPATTGLFPLFALVGLMALVASVCLQVFERAHF